MSDLYGDGTDNTSHTAQEIIAAAVEENLFTHRSPELVALLSQLDWGEKIPDELYQVIIDIVVWILEVDTQQPGKLPSPMGY
ncbi:EscU/YscU/HrcU family type III secretion system export apparatus switch protein [Microbulbifer elongatus]|uniref:EscU/YscU/HrcU family type III secretion system export apparatus switch protein n=1 Tax=Microbulbifer elongatus TaxID=86173 RepID=UPI001E2DDACF|nr:hypothetical protein [Microbulbifer elongatus]